MRISHEKSDAEASREGGCIGMRDSHLREVLQATALRKAQRFLSASVVTGVRTPCGDPLIYDCKLGLRDVKGQGKMFA
jgi:hypothetical protein